MSDYHQQREITVNIEYIHQLWGGYDELWLIVFIYILRSVGMSWYDVEMRKKDRLISEKE